MKAEWFLVAAEADPHWFLSHAQQSQRPVASLQIGLWSRTPNDLAAPLVPEACKPRPEKAPEVECLRPSLPSSGLALTLKDPLRIIDATSDGVFEKGRHALSSTTLSPGSHLDDLKVFLIYQLSTISCEEAFELDDWPKAWLCHSCMCFSVMPRLVINTIQVVELHVCTRLPNELRAASSDNKLNLNSVCLFHPKVTCQALPTQLLHDLVRELGPLLGVHA